MKKRYLSLLLCLALLLALTPAFTLADPVTSGEYGAVHWEFNTTNHVLTLTTAEETCEMPDFEAPWLVHKTSITAVNMSDKITTIGVNAFEGCSGITSFAVSGTVTKIGFQAFKDCTGLQTINFPASLTYIGKQAFLNCTSLKAANLSDSVTTLGESAFMNCSGMTSLKLGAGLSTITSSAFEGCTGLTSLTIPDTVTALNASAFKDCSGLTSVTMPADPAIYPNAFKGCAKVQTITLTKGRESKVQGNNDKTVWRNTNVNCQVFLEEGITLIDSFAFQYATKLTAITIPNSVNHIYGSAFDGCTGLKNVYYLGSKAQWDRMTIDGGNNPLKNAKRTYVDVGLEITRQPADLTVKSGENATFTVKATGQGLAYQWLFLPPGFEEWAEVPADEGGTRSTLTFPTDILIDGFKVKCRVRNAAGRVEETRDATLTVLPNVPEIVTQPKDATVLNGANATFTVKATGRNVKYRWYVKPAEEPDFAVIPGAEAATLSFVATTANNGDQYLCEVYNDDGPVGTNPATLTVTTIRTQPASAKKKSYENVTFSVKTVGANLSYQWLERENDDSRWAGIDGATEADYTFTASMDRNGWQFRCDVENEDFIEESKVVTLTVTPQRPAIKTQPKAVKVKSKAQAKFTVKATGPNLSYQWYALAAMPGAEWEDIEGATGATLSFIAEKEDNGLQLKCKVSNADGEVTSKAVKLTVTPQTPTVKTQPKAVKVKSDATAKFTVKAKGPNLSYQWFTLSTVEGAEWEPIEGATAASYSFKAKMADNGRQFRCEVENFDGKATSKAARLTVTPQPAGIKTQPKNVSVKNGDKVKYSLVGTGPNLTYQWFTLSPEEGAEWELIEGATEASYSLTAKLTDSGRKFKCLVKNEDGEKTSNVVTLTVSPAPPKFTTQPKTAKVKIGATAKFTVKASGSNVSYQWLRKAAAGGDWEEIEGATSATYSVVATAENIGDQFKCVAQNEDGSTVSSAATLKKK